MSSRSIFFSAASIAIALCARSVLAADEQNQPDEAANQKQSPPDQRSRPDFEPIKLGIFPQEIAADSSLRLIKPGHWSMAIMQTKANNFDFAGQLDARIRQSAAGNVVDLDRTPYQLEIARPAALPKGQPKWLEFPLFVPSQCTRPWLATELQSRGGSLQTALGGEPLALMKAYQYFIVVLAGEGGRYRPLDTLDSVRAPHGGQSLNYYRVAIPQLKKPLPLPANSLQWSSIAYIIWDDVDPEVLTNQQQGALIDWLYQGGQLIISGPKSLDQLSDPMFLHDYLPVLAGDPMKISAQTLAPLNEHWTLPVKKQPGKPLVPANPWNGIALRLQKNAEFLSGTGNLIAQGPVGRGRIVVTAFRLSERELWNWPSFDGFFNACLLLHPPRKFAPTGLLGELAVDWADSTQRATDPQWLTGVRYMGRDWNARSGFASPDNAAARPSAVEQNIPAATDGNTDADQSYEAADSAISGPGIAGWNDFSDVANAARDALKQAAGIVIPKTGFVVEALAIYLLVLVPVNCLLFWLIGRVEWAWIAAPIIALAGMVAVVKTAQLDIGFARSQTEIALLEVHHGYPRGLLTRFTALYTSLSTNYDVHAADPDTLILPFSADPNFTLLPGQASKIVAYRDDPNALLSGFTVSSNSTGLLHSEQMFLEQYTISYWPNADKAKPIDGRLQYCFPYPMKHAVAIRKTMQGEYQSAWFGDLRGVSSNEVTFQRGENEKNNNANGPGKGWSLDAGGTEPGASVELNLEKLARLFVGPENLQPGEIRLVGLIPQPLPGLTVDPPASQAPRGVTLVVATLQEPPLPEPRPDVNTRRDIVSLREDSSPLAPPP